MIEHPEDLAFHPEGDTETSPSADLLSHVLAQLRLTGNRMTQRSEATMNVVDIKPGMAHAFVVREGAFQFSVGSNQVRIDTGEVLLLPQGLGDGRLVAMDKPGRLIDCSFWFDSDNRRATALALPSHIHIPKQDCAGWLDPVVDFMIMEAGGAQAGAALMVSRLIDLIVIRTLRSWVHRANVSGWLGGLADARIARAVKAIHEQPRKRWSMDALAAVAGMSRSSFYDRFTSLVGQSPQRYSNEWRLALARELLSRSDARVGLVGLSVGYRSEAAFSRAYKALYGHPPRVEVDKSGERQSKKPD